MSHHNSLGLGLGIACLSFGCTTEVESTASANVRVAHLSPDAPAVDFCLAAHGSPDYTGPILTKAGHLTGLAYSNVTKYFAVDSIRYDVRLVAPGAADCSASIGGLPDFTNLPELPDGSSVTIAAEGLVAFASATPFALTPYIDDAYVDAGTAKLRFIHASPGTPAVDVGIGGGALFKSVFSDISFGGAAAAANGYIVTPAIDNAEISARPHGTLADALSIKPASLPAGAIATAFAIGRIGDAATPLRVLLCVDNAAPNALLSACSVVGGKPERAHVRVAHLSPDTPAVDICLAPAGTDAYTTSLLKSIGANDGLSYAQVTNYVDLPVGAYDVRVIHATATGCSTSALPDTKNVKLTNDLVATVAAIGDLDRSGPAAADPAFRLNIYLDVTAVNAGKVKLRFIHASPGTPAVDVGLGSGLSFTKIFANVGFGSIGAGGVIDGFGFVETAPAMVTISARLANAAQDALVIPNVMLPHDTILTAFAIGNKTGSAVNPLGVLLCADNAVSSGLLAACTVAH